MTSPISWLSPAMMHALGWALIHSLWQGAAIAALAALLLRLCRTPQARYGVGVGALSLMLAMSLVTLFAFDGSGFPVLPTNLSITLPSGPPDILPWVVVFWLGGVVLLASRFAGGFLLLELRQRRQSHAAGARVLALCQAVQQRLGLNRTIRYLECGWLQVPAVIGCIRPVVLLPVAALTGLSEAQLRAVIAHELAHVRRWDFVVNLFQILAETLLFYHPGVWWLNRRIRAERELCCDEIAVSEIGSRIAYADALVEYARAIALMEEWQSAPDPAMAANHGILSERIFHILGLPGAKPRLAGLAGGLLLLTMSLAMAGILMGVPVSISRENVPSVSATAGIAGKPRAQAEPLAVREAQAAATGPAKTYVVPRRNRLARIRANKPNSSIPLPVLMASLDLSGPRTLASDSLPVIAASQIIEPPAHVTSIAAEKLDALTMADNRYPAPLLKLNASRSIDEWTSGEAMVYCKDYAAQTVTQGANRPMLVDDSFRQRLYFFYWQCMRSNNNGVIQAYGGDWTRSPSFVAVGAASSDHPINVAGSWTILFPSSQPSLTAMMVMQAGARSCVFGQSGSTISGTCTGRDGSGALTGIIDGRQIRWAWKFTRDDGRQGDELDFIGIAGPDGVVTGEAVLIKDEAFHRPERFAAVPGGIQVASQK